MPQKTKNSPSGNDNKLEFDAKSGKLIFRGSCLEALPLCEAFCCRIDWDIDISAEEYEAKLFESEVFCKLTKKLCEYHSSDCIYRRYLLKKRKDNSCIYLGTDNKCTIHTNKPKTCQKFSCKGGWRLESVFPSDKKEDKAKIKIEKKDFLKKIQDNFTFLLHPLLKQHKALYLKEKNEIIFYKEKIGACPKYFSKDHFNNPKLDDSHLNAIIHLFEKKLTVKEMVQYLEEHSDFPITKNEFYEILWLLHKHQIILESRNFAGMLSGTGIL